MIDTFVKVWDNHKDELKDKYSKELPDSYSTIVEDIVKMINGHFDEYSDDYEKPDPERITVIDHGDYQGTQLYIIASDDYQPSTFWHCFVDYGSCSGCDTLEAIVEYDDEVTQKKVDEIMSLALHIIQGMKSL